MRIYLSAPSTPNSHDVLLSFYGPRGGSQGLVAMTLADAEKFASELTKAVQQEKANVKS